jgi:hypothetical protein
MDFHSGWLGECLADCSSFDPTPQTPREIPYLVENLLQHKSASTAVIILALEVGLDEWHSSVPPCADELIETVNDLGKTQGRLDVINI